MDLAELKERQSWTLAHKIDHSLFTIETFLTRMGNKCYVAFSGGKDSTVLLDLVRIIDKSIPAVFVNTGNEYPDIIKFVRHLRDDKGYNIIELHPKMTPREVWAKYGFPLVSKEQAEYIDRYRKNPEYAARQQARALENKWAFGSVSNKWKFLVDERFATAKDCCRILKKNPSHLYSKETGRFPILGIMASESELRQQNYIRRGGGAIHLRKTGKGDHLHCHFLSGQMMTSGHTSRNATSKYPKSITRERRGQDALAVALDANSRMTRDLNSCTTFTQSIIR